MAGDVPLQHVPAFRTWFGTAVRCSSSRTRGLCVRQTCLQALASSPCTHGKQPGCCFSSHTAHFSWRRKPSSVVGSALRSCTAGEADEALFCRRTQYGCLKNAKRAQVAPLYQHRVCLMCRGGCSVRSRQTRHTHTSWQPHDPNLLVPQAQASPAARAPPAQHPPGPPTELPPASLPQPPASACEPPPLPRACQPAQAGYRRPLPRRRRRPAWRHAHAPATAAACAPTTRRPSASRPPPSWPCTCEGGGNQEGQRGVVPSTQTRLGSTDTSAKPAAMPHSAAARHGNLPAAQSTAGVFPCTAPTWTSRPWRRRRPAQWRTPPAAAPWAGLPPRREGGPQTRSAGQRAPTCGGRRGGAKHWHKGMTAQ